MAQISLQDGYYLLYSFSIYEEITLENFYYLRKLVIGNNLIRLKFLVAEQMKL